METLDHAVPAATADYMPDAAITAAIEAFFLAKKGVAADLIDVITSDGIVELTGFTDSLLSRQRAEDIALAIRGVRAVVNELRIRTPDVADEELQADVTRALTDDPATAGYNVRCTVAEGRATPVGTVQSWAEKQLVLRVLQGVRGVRSIDPDQLVLRTGENQNSDEEMAIQIRELLDWDIRVNSALVEVRVENRVVHLAGTVGTAAERARVEALAYQAGAARVEARALFSAYWALNSALRRQKFAPRADEAIAQAVLDAFRYDPRVCSTEPRVRVHDGVVTLSGAVSNLRARQEAEHDARHVVGVREVHNWLKVRPARPRPDADVRLSIEQALTRDPYVGHFAFAVSVFNGQAYLAGRVSNQFEQEQAGAVASAVRGVTAVANWVSVARAGAPGRLPAYYRSAVPALLAGPRTDHALAEHIREHYYWSSLYCQPIEVAVKKFRATLTGTVDTADDRRRAACDAYEAGARDVNNHLMVRES